MANRPMKVNRVELDAQGLSDILNSEAVKTMLRNKARKLIPDAQEASRTSVATEGGHAVQDVWKLEEENHRNKRAGVRIVSDNPESAYIEAATGRLNRMLRNTRDL